MNKVLKLFAAFVVALVGSSANAAGFDSAGVVDHTGNWWNPAQNMMGVAIHQQHGLIQAEWFIYDAVNKPTWLSFSGPLKKDAQGNDTLTSPLYRTHGPQPMGYNASFAGVDQPSAGTMSITFSDACHATMNYLYTDPSGGLPQQETLTLTQLLFGDVACTTPEKVKVASPQPVPTGCIDASMQCWKDAVRGGTVKFISSSVKMVGLTGAQAPLVSRPIMFAYFINGGPVSAVSGPYSMAPFYADTGEPIFPVFVSSGLAAKIDWAMGTDTGVLFHTNDGTGCWQWDWQAPTPSGGGGAWSMDPASCP